MLVVFLRRPSAGLLIVPSIVSVPVVIFRLIPITAIIVTAPDLPIRILIVPVAVVSVPIAPTVAKIVFFIRDIGFAPPAGDSKVARNLGMHLSSCGMRGADILHFVIIIALHDPVTARAAAGAETRMPGSLFLPECETPSNSRIRDLHKVGKLTPNLAHRH
jgi:hypothetical protein